MASAMIAHAYDTSWISSGQTLSSAQLKTDLDEVQRRLATLEATPAPPVVTDWQSYTPTLLDIANGTAIGNQGTTGEWRRVGDTLEMRILTSISGVPTGAGCSDYWIWSFPPGLSKDPNAIASNSVGYGNLVQQGNGYIVPLAASAGHTYVAALAETSDTLCFVNASTLVGSGSIGAGATISLFAMVPIDGWGSGSGSGSGT